MGYEGRSKNLAYSYTTRNFLAEVVFDEKEQRNRVKLVHDLYYQTEINKFKVGEKLSLNLTSKKPKRTESQNRYYWGVYLPLIAKETGNDVDDLHNLFKGKFLSKAIVECLGEKVRRIRSTTDLSVSDFMEYIQRIEEMTGILSPPTDDYYNN